LDAIQRYQDVERNYQMKYRQRIERQIRIGKITTGVNLFIIGFNTQGI
jgi:t-SNARE complex subunit (syntaxin)